MKPTLIHSQWRTRLFYSTSMFILSPGSLHYPSASPLYPPPVLPPSSLYLPSSAQRLFSAVSTSPPTSKTDKREVLRAGDRTDPKDINRISSGSEFTISLSLSQLFHHHRQREQRAFEALTVTREGWKWRKMKKCWKWSCVFVLRKTQPVLVCSLRWFLEEEDGAECRCKLTFSVQC